MFRSLGLQYLAVLALWPNFVAAQLGKATTDVPWRAGHAGAYVNPYVILYGGTNNVGQSYPGTVTGSNTVSIWDSRSGEWFNPQLQGQTAGNGTRGQVYIAATALQSPGQMLVITENTTESGMLQKLDINSWSWSFPSTATSPPARAASYALTRVNNTVYTFGGTSVDANGFPSTGAILNSLNTLDADSFAWSSASNGPAITGHSMCYIQSCNCLVIFGGTSTGSGADATKNVFLYDLGTRTWNLQVTVAASNGVPGGRQFHTATCLRDKMVVYGGGTTQAFYSDVWVLNAVNYPSLSWERVDMTNVEQGPSNRMGHTAILNEGAGKIYIFGGWGATATGDLNMYILDTIEWSWTRVPTTGLKDAGKSTSGTSGISKGALAGAVVGGVIGAALIGFLVFFFWRKRRQQRKLNDDVSEKSYDNHYDDGHHTYWDDNDNYGDEFIRYSNVDMRHASIGSGFNQPKRVSKVLANPGSPRESHILRSVKGDNDRVVTSVLEEMHSDSISELANYSNGTRSLRDSLHTSRALLMDQSNQQSDPIGQKPNEFSVPAKRFAALNGVPVEHYVPMSPSSPSSPDTTAPLSSSMDVLRSINTATTQPTSSVIGQHGDSTISSPQAYIVTHATHGEPRQSEQDDATTNFTESLSYQAQSSAGPIRYIPAGASKQFSLATTATTATLADQAGNPGGESSAVPLTHHQYPSSNMSVPLARAVTPPPSASDPVVRNSLSEDYQSPRQSNQVYNAVSPLERLVALGNTGTPAQENNSSPLPDEHRKSDNTASGTTGTTVATDERQRRFAALEPLSSMLPRRYQVDKDKAPIIGPMNSVLFVNKMKEQAETTKAVVKSFGRREAWERECRTLIKLKSTHVVEILEVLTIQDESRTPLPHRHKTDDGSSDEGAYGVIRELDDGDTIKYVTVMERLDETLSTAIRQARSEKHAWSRPVLLSIVRDIVNCLVWCHSRGVAFCDLKPSNIMHRAGGDWKLVDFEASRTIGEECVGVITPRYCPPEVARATTHGLEGANGVVAAPTVDLWSLGCVIYELETKHALFTTNTKDETILHFISHPSPSTPILNNGLRWNEHKELYIPNLERQVPNAHARQLIKMLLSREPSKRGSASDLLKHAYFNSS